MGKASSTKKSPKSAAPSIEDVKATVRQLIEENAGIPADSVQDDSAIDGDLAMDSFSLLSVQVAVEEAFEVNLDLNELQARNRFDAICGLIVERIAAKKASASGKETRSKTSGSKST